MARRRAIERGQPPPTWRRCRAAADRTLPGLLFYSPALQTSNRSKMTSKGLQEWGKGAASSSALLLSSCSLCCLSQLQWRGLGSCPRPRKGWRGLGSCPRPRNVLAV